MLFQIGLREPPAPVIVNEGVRLRGIRLEDYTAWTSLREESRRHLTAWEPDWRAKEMTPSAYRRRIRVYWRDMEAGNSLTLIVERESDEELLGGVTLSNIRMGASRSGVLGYWIGFPHIRRGYGRAAALGMLAHAFGAMGLNRVEAACQPENAASIALLESVGFTREGLARQYLRINGAWRDHLLYAITAEDYANR